MSSNSKGPEKAKTAANAVTVAVAAVGVVIGLNIIATRFSAARFDLTQDKVFKLSPSSLEAVKSLPDRVTVKAFISNGLPPPLNSYGQYIRDLLDEYAAASGGKLVWEGIDPLAPGKDEEDTKAKREEYKSKYKIKAITLQTVSQTKLEIGSDNYLGLAFVYGEQIESIPQIAQTERLEYNITSMLKKLTATRHKKLGLASSEGELTQQNGLQWMPQIVTDYDPTEVQLDKPIPDDIDLLMVIGPHAPFTDKAKFYLDQFLMKGKGVGLFVDGMVVESPRNMQMQIPGMESPKIGRGNDVNLVDLLDKYGFKVEENLVMDKQNAPGAVQVEGQTYVMNYPVFVGVSDKAMTPKFAVTDHVNAIVTPFASSVALTGDLKEGKTGLKLTQIAHTSDNHSWKQSGFFVFNPTVKLEPTPDKGPFALGYALEGHIKSAFPGGAPAGVTATDVRKESESTARLIVFGSSGLFNIQHLGPVIQHAPVYLNNLLFFNNATDWLAHDESLIALRAKGMGQRPLQVPPESHARLWQYLCELGIPAGVVLFGVLLWFLRSSRRRAVALI